MRLCCCFPSAAQQATTTRENQTFRGAEQDGGSHNSMQHSAKACSHSLGAPLTSDSNPYPAPTEHRLSWSHAPHPPSVASSTLFDPEGQAFAKHYNPLLSGETSHGSQYSSDKSPNAVPLKRLGEAQAPQPHSQSLPSPEQSSEHDSQTATSQYTAPPDQAMHAIHGATPLTATAQHQETDKPPVDRQGLVDVCSGTPQGIWVQGAAGEGVADLGIAGLGGVDQASRGVQGGADPSRKQPSLGRQLGDALKLRNWKPNRPADPSRLTDDVNSKSAMSLSPRTESAMMMAASQLGFDARLAGKCQPPAQPTFLPVADSQAAGSEALPCLAPHAPERPLPGPPSLSAASVTMLQSMTARAASFRAGSMHDALTPPSPVPSIDRFSSMSSWGASCSSHGSGSSPLGSRIAGTGRSGTAQQVSIPSCDTAHHLSGITEEVDRQHGKPQLSSTSGSAMRAMHDSSSSWTGSSVPPQAKAAAKQQAAVADTHTADADAGQTEHLQESAVPDGPVDMQRSTVVYVDQATVARPDAGVAAAAAPENAGAVAREADTPLQLLQPVATAKTSDGAGVSNKPKQTLEEMAAWLDAQLAAAPGRRPVKAATSNSPVQSTLAVKKGNPATTAVGVTLPLAMADSRHASTKQTPLRQSPSLPLIRSPSQPASALSTSGSRVSGQARSKPTGLPLPRKASPAGPMGRVVGKQASLKGKGSDLSVTEMMQWLDSKLGQSAVTVPAKPATSRGSNQDAGASAAAAAAAAATGKLSQQHPSGTASITEAAAASDQEGLCSLQHDHPGHCSVDSDSASCQPATAGGQEGSCTLGQQPAVPDVGPTQASQQASSSDSPAAAAGPPQAASVTVPQHSQHSFSQRQLPAPESVNATAAVITTSVSAAADGQAVANAADDKGVSTSLAAAAGKESCSGSAPAMAIAASTAGVSVKHGAVGQSGGGAEGQQRGLPAAPPAQTAAEMLSWLDATLSAKKPLKASGSVPSKVSAAGLPGSVKASVAKQKQLGSQVTPAAIKGAGTTDMLAWLDAKIAAQRAALIN